MTRTKSSRALVSVVLAVLMAVAFMPAISFSSFAATAKKATKVTKVYHKANTTFTRTAGTAWTLKYKLSPSKLTAAAKKVVWKSSNKSVVSVSAKSGNRAAVSFKKAGTATVTVYTKANKKAKATWKFKVTKKAEKTTLTGVTISAANVKDKVSDKVTVGETLTASVAPSDAKNVTYQWYADGTAIDGATSADFTVTTAQSGKALTVKATSENTVESAKTANVDTVTVDNFYIDGTANVGETLKVKAQAGSPLADLSNDVDQLATVEWHRVTTGATTTNKVDTVVGTGASYKVADADKGSTLYAVVTPNKDVKVATTINGINGTPVTGKTVTAKDGKYTLPETSPVGAANTSVSKVVMKADGKALANNADVKAGTTLTTEVTPAAAASALDYQWYKDGYKIDGATSDSYTPSEAGTYKVKVSVKKDNLVYTASNVTYEGFAVVAKTYKEFTGVSLVNVKATNEKRTTNLANDKYAVEVSGLKAGTDYTVVWYKQTTDAYGKVNAPNDTDKLGTGQTYTGSGLTAGNKIYAVITGVEKSSYKDYKTTTSTITIDDAAATTIPAFTLPKTDNTAVTTTYTPATGNKIVWQKAPVSTIGLDTTWTDTTTTGSTYQLSTAEQAGGFMLRAKVVDANGKVVGYSSNTLTATTTNGVLAFSTAATVIK